MNAHHIELMIGQLSDILPAYQLKCIRYYPNSINGVLEHNFEKKFFKIGLRASIERELRGQIEYSKINECPEVDVVLNIGEEYSIILFEYIESLNDDQQALYYTLESTQNHSEKIRNILAKYFKTFTKIKNIDEVSSKFNNFQYSRFFYERLNRVRDISTDDQLFKIIISKSVLYIENMTLERLRFLTHGDPSDMNFSKCGIFYDFEEVDYNDISLEFSILFWNFFIGGGYLYPKYHGYKYIDIKEGYDKLSYKGITENRKNILLYIIGEMERIHKENNLVLNEKFIYCLIFRMLSVIPFTELEKSDQELVKSLVKVLYSWILQGDISIFEMLLQWIIGEFNGEFIA